MLERRDQAAILGRLQAQMELDGLKNLILTAPDTIFYATGFGSTSLYETFKAGTTLAVVPVSGNPTLICSEFELQPARTTTKNVNVIAYETWIYIEDYAKPGVKKEVQPDLYRTYKMAAEVIKEAGDPGEIGIEPAVVNHGSYLFLESVFGADHLHDCTHTMVESRAIKTPWEIEMLRLGAHYSEIAMQKTAHALLPGMTEADVFQMYQIFCREQSTFVSRISHAHTIGKNFGPTYIPRTDRIERGDIVRLDGGPAICGYNADIARSFVVGDITNPRCEKVYSALWKGYEAGIATLGPGVKMCEPFFAIQKAIADAGLEGYVRGHHGHSIGCSIICEEAPFMAPDETRVFEPGMVFCMEIPWYSSDAHSYNIEDTFLITENGVELFTKSCPTLYL